MRILLPLMLLFACKSTDVQQTSPPPQRLVSLQTHGCFGFCPMFTLTLWNNGRLDYLGDRFVEKSGPDTVFVSAEELARLKTAIESTNLWQYPENIPTQIADAPSATLTAFRADGTSHRVKGSMDRPQPVLDLQKMLQNTAEAHGLKVNKGVNPNEIPPEQRREVVVLLKPEVNAGNWIRQFTDIKVQLLQRTGTENRWLVGYNPKEIEEKAVLERLRNSEGAVEATPNRRSQERE
ncbi:MAG: hypothetical protein IT270_04665 [Saprospiraceae bacterium]|nr:hypothetical protein [Saprospiraceae bacterium]